MSKFRIDVLEGFPAIEEALVEISPLLKAKQRERLRELRKLPRWKRLERIAKKYGKQVK